MSARISKEEVRRYALEFLWKSAYGLTAPLKYITRLRRDEGHLRNYIKSHPTYREEYCSLLASFILMTDKWDDINGLRDILDGRGLKVCEKIGYNWKCYCEEGSFKLDPKVEQYIKLRILDIIERKIEEGSIDSKDLIILNEIGPDREIRRKIIRYVSSNERVDLLNYIYDQDIAKKLIAEFIHYNKLGLASKVFEVSPAMADIRMKINAVKDQFDRLIEMMSDKDKVTVETLDILNTELKESLYNLKKLEEYLADSKLLNLESVMNKMISIKTKINEVIEKLMELREYYEEKLRKIKIMYINGSIDPDTFEKSRRIFEKAINIINNIFRDYLAKRVDKKDIKRRLKTLEELFNEGEISKGEYEYLKKKLENMLKFIG